MGAGVREKRRRRKRTKGQPKQLALINENRVVHEDSDTVEQ